MFIVCSFSNCPLSKLNSLNYICNSDRIKGFNFCIMRANFGKELTSSGKLFLRFVSADVFFFDFFLSLLLLFRLLHFLCENGIGPALTSIMSYLCLNRKWENKLKCCIVNNTFVDKLNLETSWEFIFVRTF